MRYDVEVESEPIENFTLPLEAAQDRLTRLLGERRDLIGGGVAAHPDSRCISVQVTIDAKSVLEAVRLVADRLEPLFERAELGALRIRSLHCAPEEARGETRTTAPSPQMIPMAQSWPPQFRNRRMLAATRTVAAPAAADVSRVWGEVAALTAQLRQSGHADHALALEHALRPGRSVAETCVGLRHELSMLRMTEIPVLLDRENQIDALIASVSRLIDVAPAAG